MKTHPRMLACSVSLLVLPVAFAGNPDEKFATMDANGDGKVSRTEHREAAETKFKQLDKNHDGVVSAGELKALQGEGSDADGAAARAKWKMMDRNADGRISENEHETAVYTMFGEMDSNRDRFLSLEEIKAGHEKKMERSDS